MLKVSRAIQAAFSGKRIVIFSGGAQKSSDDVIDEVREINAGGGFGSILGRNAFQRPRAEGIELLRRVIGVYQGP